MGWRRFFRRAHWDRERTRELEAYLEIETDDNIARGMPPDRARDAARRKLGSTTRIREEIYEMNTLRRLDSLWQDVRYALRVLRKNPIFALVAILSLALGIGANTAFFQLIDAVRLRTLPVAAPSELADVRITDFEGARGAFTSWRPSVTYPIWERIREHQRAFSGIFAWSDDLFNISPAGEPRVARGLWVSGGFFPTLGVTPLLGRLLTPDDDRRGCGSPGAVISYAFWQREYGGDPHVVGRTVTLVRRPIEIIGVTPARFYGVEVGRSFDVAIPICADGLLLGAGSRLDAGTTWWLTVMGRLAPGWTIERAAADLLASSASIFRESLPPNYPTASVNTYLAFTLTAVPAGGGVSQLREAYSRPLSLLLGLAALVLVIACANLANLMLARSTARAREIAVRLALGASRARVMRQLLVESLVLAGAGALAGVALATALSGFLVRFVSEPQDPWFVELSLDWRVVGFTGALAVLTCVLFGLMPAWRATRRDPGLVIKSSGRGLTADRERFGARRVLVVSQLALSLVLLAGALLFARSLQNLLNVGTGFDRRAVAVAEISLGPNGAETPPDRRRALQRDTLDRVRAIPGVTAAASTDIVPLSGASWSNTVWMDASAQRGDTNWARVSAGYFATLGIPMLAGRDFDDRDTPGSPRVAIVNESFVRDIAGGGDVIGRRFWVEQTPNDPQMAYDIIGVVKDTKYRDLRDPFGPIGYLARTQDPRPGMYVQTLVKSNLAPDALAASLKRAAATVSPQASVSLDWLDDQIARTLVRDRLMATLSGFFGALAALLATVGLYGVISYMVVQRRNEIGIRIALGADRRAVIALILREASMLLIAGLTLGTLLTIAAVQPARTLVFNLQPADPATLAGSIALLALVTTLAALIPARRAARVSPMTALREE